MAILASRSQRLPFALIWTEHIALDRMLGYGLKYPTRFKDTHIMFDQAARNCICSPSVLGGGLAPQIASFAARSAR